MNSTYRQWEEFLATSNHQAPLKDVILHSWERSRDAGLDPQAAKVELKRIDDGELERRIADNRNLLEIATPHLAWASLILSQIPHVVYITDCEGIILSSTGSDTAAMQVFGLIPGYDWSEPVMGTNGAGTALAAGRPVAVIGSEHYLAPFHDFACFGSPIRNSVGNIVGAVDISTSLQDGAPDRLLLSPHLAEVISQEFATRQRTEVSAALTTLARLSSFTAHELVTPLWTLTTSLDLLRKMVQEETPTRVVERCQRQVEQMLRLIEDLRILGGADNRQPEEIKLPVLLRNLVISLGVSHPCIVELDGDWEQLPPLQGHPRLLRQALLNLLRNSLDAVEERGKMGVRVHVQDGAVKITVWDEGPGIPAEKCRLLFQEPFTTKETGSGLGLLLVRRVVEQIHGGRVSFTPHHPHGAEFHLELPR